MIDIHEPVFLILDYEPSLMGTTPLHALKSVDKNRVPFLVGIRFRQPERPTHTVTDVHTVVWPIGQSVTLFIVSGCARHYALCTNPDANRFILFVRPTLLLHRIQRHCQLALIRCPHQHSLRLWRLWLTWFRPITSERASPGIVCPGPAANDDSLNAASALRSLIHLGLAGLPKRCVFETVIDSQNDG